MMDKCIIEINNKRIKAIKNTRYVVCTERRYEKIIYIIKDMSIYYDIPEIVEIYNKKFYKSPYDRINQEEFKLIEC